MEYSLQLVGVVLFSPVRTLGTEPLHAWESWAQSWGSPQSEHGRILPELEDFNCSDFISRGVILVPPWTGMER